MKPNRAERNADAVLNVLGKTSYVDDLPEPTGLLHGAVFVSPSAVGTFDGIDSSAVRAAYPGAVVLAAADIPGQNQVGTAVMDEELLADGAWHFRGQVLALVLAPSRSTARKAAALLKIVGRKDGVPIVDPRVAYARGDIILKPRIQACGDVDAAFAACDLVVEGRADSGGQEHVYLETQGSIAWPDDSGGVRLVSGTQSPAGVQTIVARVLGVPLNLVEIETRRLGGAFGGKEDQANGWAALAALGAVKTGRPVKLYLNRRDDMASTGKRHPYSSDYRVGLRRDGTILAFEATYYQNSGATADLSPAIIPRTLFHATGAYGIPNVRVTGVMCRTNLVPFTAFRGFGGPQGFFVIESAVENAARALGVDPVELQRKNLCAEGDLTHYGMRLDDVRAAQTFDACLRKAGWAGLRAEMSAFNAAHRAEKRGMAAFPLCFGISFTKIMLNQGGALVHVFRDGSVSVSTGAIEMGQGVARKISRIAADALGTVPESVRVESTRTTTVANTVATAASTGTDINGMAARIACLEIRKRLVALASAQLGIGADAVDIRDGRVLARVEAAGSAAGRPAPGAPGFADAGGNPAQAGGAGAYADAGLSFAELAAAAFESRLDLSAHAFYATPGLAYDLAAEKGTPFLYHVYGAAVVTATLDVIRGRYRFDRAFIVHDLAESVDPLVDMGQIEGAFAQGLGWAALEDLRFDSEGRLLSDTLSTYKLPDADFMPEMLVETLERPNPKAVANSKAVGEPPLMYGIAGYFAVLDALKAARPDMPSFHDLPMTPEKAMNFLTASRVLKKTKEPFLTLH